MNNNATNNNATNNNAATTRKPYKLTICAVANDKGLSSKGFRFSWKELTTDQTAAQFLDGERAARNIKRGDKRALSLVGLDIATGGKSLFAAAAAAYSAALALSGICGRVLLTKSVSDILASEELKRAAAAVEDAQEKLTNARAQEKNERRVFELDNRAIMAAALTQEGATAAVEQWTTPQYVLDAKEELRKAQQEERETSAAYVALHLPNLCGALDK